MENEKVVQQRLPSAFQPNDKVGLQMLINLMEAAGNGQATKVSFLPGKVRYDITIPLVERLGTSETDDDMEDKVLGYFRIANVDSALLNKPFNNGFHYNSERDFMLREAQGKVPQQPKEDEVRISPFDHGGYFTSNDTPSPMSEGESYQVLIDLDGRRKTYSIGHYDFKEEKWIVYNNKELFNLEHMRWTTLPIDTDRPLGDRCNHLKGKA